MTPAAIVSLGGIALIFVIWAGAMFQMLWLLNRRALDRQEQTGGGYFTWVGHSLNLFSSALTSDKDRQMRRRILILTGLLVLSIAANVYVLKWA